MKATVEVPTVKEGKSIKMELDTETEQVRLYGNMMRRVKLEDFERGVRQLRNIKEGL